MNQVAYALQVPIDQVYITLTKLSLACVVAMVLSAISIGYSTKYPSIIFVLTISSCCLLPAIVLGLNMGHLLAVLIENCFVYLLAITVLVITVRSYLRIRREKQDD